MEKICKRCGFRTPSARTICQVCGNGKFVLRETEDARTCVTPAAQFTSIDTVQTALRRTIESAATHALSVIERLNQTRALVAASQTVSRTPTLVSVASQSAETMVAEQSFEGNSLEEMIAWFKSYGVDRPLILPANNNRSSEFADDLSSKAA